MLSDEYLFQFGDPKEVAAFLGVSARTFARYQSAPHQAPEACKRLLRFRLNGDMAALTGHSEWTGFYLCHDGSLHVPLFEQSFEPRRISAMFFKLQELVAMRDYVRELEEKAWAAEKVREAERSGSLHAKMQQHAEALKTLSAALSADLDEARLEEEYWRENLPK